jgi:uncharacterized protein (TIGR03905 family)
MLSCMKSLSFTPRGVCARRIDVTIDDEGIVQDVAFVGGCDGNHKGIIKLVKGMRAEKVADLLEGTTCGWRKSSCPDQLAKALRKALE